MPLRLDKVLRPEKLGKNVARTDSLCLGRALGVDFMLVGGSIGTTLAHSHHRAGVTLHVSVHGEGGIHVPLDHIGSAFVMQGGVTGDCDIYVHSLFQADLQNCEPVPASGQYKGGKIIVHAYITGFFSHLAVPTKKI